MTTIEVESTAQAYLRLLRERGVDYFFGNAGTDFASIIDAFARADLLGTPAPSPITVPHEVPAIAMAYGYYMITGRPQAVSACERRHSKCPERYYQRDA